MKHETGICINCGAGDGLHHFETKQCPRHGIEETRFDKLAGKFYPQQWQDTTFEDAGLRKLYDAASELLETLIQIRRHGLIEKDGYETNVRKMNEAIKKATP